MRWVKIALVVLAIWSFALTALTVGLLFNQKRNRQSFDSLAELLEIRRWDLPAPSDTRYEWHFEVRDSDQSAVSNGKDDWMDARRKATIVFMPIGQDEVYRFWLLNVNGTSSGTTRLDVCDNPDDVGRKCDFGQLDYEWYKEPKRIGDGKSYLICDINETLGLKRRKQLILYLAPYRLEDIHRNLQKM